MAAGEPAKAPNPNPNPAGSWTVVCHRLRRREKPRPETPASPLLRSQAPSPTHPTPWTPLDPIVDPARISKLLHRMQSAICRLEGSRFYRLFLAALRGARVQSGLARLSPTGAPIHMVVYGVGSIESFDSPRLQLALAVLLRRELGPAAAAVELFDPVLSATECAVAAALGCAVMAVDEEGRRKVMEPTLFYMPHCEAALYDGLLTANWTASALGQMAVLGNSFAEYGRHVAEVGWCGGSVAVAAVARHVLGVRKYVREVGIQENGGDGDLEWGKEDVEDGFFKAFHDTSWHFFELDNDDQLSAITR